MSNTPVKSAPIEYFFDRRLGGYSRPADYRNYSNALGYSYLFYINDMINAATIKPLAVNGVTPDIDSIVKGEYPFRITLYAVTVKNNDGTYLNPEREESITELISWMLSPQGQRIVSDVGFFPLEEP